MVIEGHFLPISSTSYFIFNKRVFLVELLFNIFAYIAASMEHVSGSEHVIVYLLLPVHLQNGKSVSSKSGKDLFFYSSVLGEGLPHLWSSGSHTLVQCCLWRENQATRRTSLLLLLSDVEVLLDMCRLIYF